LVGRNVADFVLESLHFIDNEALLRDERAKSVEVLVATRDRHLVSCLLSIKVLFDDSRDMIGLIFLLHDITERKMYEELLMETNMKLESKVRARTEDLEASNLSLQKEILEREVVQSQIDYTANHDALTGLLNRRFHYERLQEAIELTQSSGDVLAVLYLDIDDFKHLNDTYGHRYGDLVLKEVAERMTQSLRHGDTLARIGGDEFLLLIEKLKPETARETMEGIQGTLHEILREPFQINDCESFLSLSVGIAIYPYDGTDPEMLIKNADIAMYEAKYSGKNTYRFCSSEMKQKVLDDAQIRGNLFHALHNDEMILYYQPQIEVETQRIIGFEALLRWQIQKEVFVPPLDFIPIAEETGLIVPIGTWVMKQAFLQLKQWHERGWKHLRMAVNVSPRQLKDKKFIEHTLQWLVYLDLDPQHVEFEITEGIPIEYEAEVFNTLQQIKQSNISIAIDDFGTKYSSFMNIKALPINRLKIDRSFVMGIGSSSTDEAIIRSIIIMSREIGVKVLAEGVETAEQVAYLQQNHCDEIQGFYYYRPMPPEKIEQLLEQI